jgi:type I restriction enzyme S subunit
MTRSNTQDNLNAEQVGNLEVPCPPIGAQSAIADFLDRETAKIDALIAKQEALVEGLLARRQAVIDGAIPWSEGRAQLRRDLTFLTSGSRGWGDYYADEGEVFLRISDLSRGTYALKVSNLQRVQIPSDVEGSRSCTRAGDLLFSITAYLGSVGIVPSDLEGSWLFANDGVVASW